MLGDERLRLTEEQQRWLAGLHESQFDRMLRMAGRALPSPNRLNAEDVVQTVFAEAVAASSNRPWVQIGEGWLIRRLRARVADFYRARGRQQRLLAAAATLESPASAEEIAIDGTAVDELLAAIPDRDDRLALMFKLYGYREAEIAQLLSVPYEGRQVRDRMQRVRRQVDAWRSATPGREPEASGRT